MVYYTFDLLLWWGFSDYSLIFAYLVFIIQELAPVRVHFSRFGCVEFWLGVFSMAC